MVRVIASHIIQVVVFAGHAHALLRVDGAGVGPLIGAKEYLLELHHASVGEEQGLVAAGNERGRWHIGVANLLKKFDESFADLCTGRWRLGLGGHLNSLKRGVMGLCERALHTHTAPSPHSF